jgi:hypothetical protein
MRLISTILAAAIAIGVPAMADDSDTMSPATVKAFAAYLESPSFAGRLADMVAMAKSSQFSGCDSVTTGAPSSIVVATVKMGPDGIPVDGVWKTSLYMDGCGTSRQTNAFFIVNNEKKIFFLLEVPGTSRGDFQLQKDTVMYVRMAAVQKSMDCKGTKIVNSRFDGTVTDGPKPGVVLQQAMAQHIPWREIWTVDACGKFLEVGIDYSAGFPGTTIRASSQDVTEITAEQAAKR